MTCVTCMTRATSPHQPSAGHQLPKFIHARSHSQPPRTPAVPPSAHPSPARIPHKPHIFSEGHANAFTNSLPPIHCCHVRAGSTPRPTDSRSPASRRRHAHPRLTSLARPLQRRPRRLGRCEIAASVSVKLLESPELESTKDDGLWLASRRRRALAVIDVRDDRAIADELCSGLLQEKSDAFQV